MQQCSVFLCVSALRGTAESIWFHFIFFFASGKKLKTPALHRHCILLQSKTATSSNASAGAAVSCAAYEGGLAAMQWSPLLKIVLLRRYIKVQRSILWPLKRLLISGVKTQCSRCSDKQRLLNHTAASLVTQWVLRVQDTSTFKNAFVTPPQSIKGIHSILKKIRIWVSYLKGQFIQKKNPYWSLLLLLHGDWTLLKH